MAETMTATEPSTNEMSVTGPSPETASASGASGYEAFIADSCAANIDIKAMIEKAPSPKAITDRAQSIITAYFPPDGKVVEKKAGNDMAGEGAPPELTASSSSEGSKTKEEEPSSWADKLSSQCQMDTACGKCELEFSKKEELTASNDNALTEQGELLAIDGAPPPTPWTRQVSEATADTLASVSTKASGLMVALGLTAKKDQGLITDYYKADPTPQKTQKSLSFSDKVQDLQSNVRSLQASVMSTLGMSPREKEMKQTLITKYDPNKVDQKDASTEEIPDPKVEQAESVEHDEIISVATEAASETNEKKEEKTPLRLWNKLKGFFKMLHDQTAMCDPQKVGFQAGPEVEVPECSDLKAPTEVKTPRIEIPSITLFSCNPNVALEEEEIENTEEAKAEKTEETSEVEKTEGTKKVENTQPASPRESPVPW
eukprot:CAMPEP_0181100044 /NCGR_PEP_ID=MMETSP1071-20121207/12984_1 /TAXON_ID=35127 /ORGANISM="Thalassiosira sp., Strain NH16" /LENGTH=429 /DNA_ID=CAMNT_0023182749 /DNA_START=106 /DNA_END=1392 /DNA_ORIENTATION=-